MMTSRLFRAKQLDDPIKIHVVPWAHTRKNHRKQNIIIFCEENVIFRFICTTGFSILVKMQYYGEIENHPPDVPPAYLLAEHPSMQSLSLSSKSSCMSSSSFTATSPRPSPIRLATSDTLDTTEAVSPVSYSSSLGWRDSTRRLRSEIKKARVKFHVGSCYM